MKKKIALLCSMTLLPTRYNFANNSSIHTKILHLSFHKGCIQEIEAIAEKLNVVVTSCFIQNLPPFHFDGKATGNALYNIGYERARDVWNKHKNYFNQFDIIITSDTTPLSRIFLQNGYRGKLVVWICNRFDYCDTVSKDCVFPDQAYYQLLNHASKNLSNVTFVSYTPYEHTYAHMKGFFYKQTVIRPTGLYQDYKLNSHIPNYIDKKKTLFIPPYESNIYFVNLEHICQQMALPAFIGKYHGPKDIKDFKGVLFIPYAISNIFLFENLQNELVHFIPTPAFMKKLHNSNKKYSFTHVIQNSDWYHWRALKELFVFFDSWQDLKNKVNTTNYEEKKEKIRAFISKHTNNTLHQWRTLLKN